MKRFLAVFTLIIAAAVFTAGCSLNDAGSDKAHVKVLILPAFEVEKMAGDFPGEAQYYYEEYLTDGEEYDIKGCNGDATLYYKDDIALLLLNEGKVNSALNLGALLSDERFDFSDAYVLLTGCAGAAEGYGIMGDVFLITASFDYDLGHHADPREMESDSKTTWFHDESYNDSAATVLEEDLMDSVYGMVKDVPLKTTKTTVEYLEQTYPGEKWANRPPQVLRGTSATGDNFWKGKYDHENALLMTETYECPDPYAVTDMEDVAVCEAAERFGLTDRLIILRAAVNMDVFATGITPEKLWGEKSDDALASDESDQSFDIFAIAMENNFKVGKIVIEAILNDKL